MISFCLIIKLIMIIMIMIIMPGSGVAHLYSQNWEVDRGRRISEFD